jgi:hypothetical protein
MGFPLKALDDDGREIYVRADGHLTEPRSFGVCRVQRERGAVSFHFGNHPVRQWELERQHGSAEVVRLFLDREAAKALRAKLARSG